MLLSRSSSRLIRNVMRKWLAISAAGTSMLAIYSAIFVCTWQRCPRSTVEVQGQPYKIVETKSSMFPLGYHPWVPAFWALPYISGYWPVSADPTTDGDVETWMLKPPPTVKRL